MQPYFFPYLGYFQLVHAVDRFFLYDNLGYSRGSWVNRNRILEARRGSMFISVPVVAPRRTQTIRDTLVSDERAWRGSMLRSIEQTYGRSEYFAEVYALIQSVVLADTRSLAQLTKRSVSTVCEFLQIETEILLDSTPFDRMEVVLRDETGSFETSFPWLELDAPARKVVRALALCREAGAGVFINAIGGRQLYRKEDFRRHGVELFFTQKRAVLYPQPSTQFVPDLSIIDVLMNCGRDTTRRLLLDYDLV